jgi:hypothetical protein
MYIGLLMALVAFVRAVTEDMVDNNEIEKRKHNKHHMKHSHAFLPSLLLLLLLLPFYRVM